MTKLTIYAIVFARLFILLCGFILLPLFFLLFIIAQIGQVYLSGLFAFTTNTKEAIALYDHELNKEK